MAGFDQSRHRHVPRAASNQAYIVSNDVDQADVAVDPRAALTALRGWISRYTRQLALPVEAARTPERALGERPPGC